MALQAAALRDATPPRAVHAGAGRHGAAALGPRFWGQRSGDSLHRREETRYTLEIAGDPVAALKLARDNWKVQREVADLRVLAAAAKAAGDAAALREATDWAHRNRLEDASLNALLETR